MFPDGFKDDIHPKNKDAAVPVVISLPQVAFRNRPAGFFDKPMDGKSGVLFV